MNKEGSTKPSVEVLPYKYQPTKVKLNKDLRIPTTPEKLTKAVVADIHLEEEKTPR